MSSENLNKEFLKEITSFPDDSNIITKIIDVIKFEHNVSNKYLFKILIRYTSYLNLYI